MFPYLLEIGSFQLRFYSLMIIIGLLFVIFMSRYRAKQLGYKPELMENMIVIIFIFSLIGARLYYVIFSWDHYKDNLLEIFAVWHGGLAIHGGLIFGFLGSYFYAKYSKVKMMFYGDIIMPWVLFGQGLGRFGNFANGEAHGVPTITPPDIIFRIKPIFTDFWATVLSKFNLPNTPEGVSKLNTIVAQGGANVEFQGKIYELKEYVPWGISFPDIYRPAAYLEFGSLAVHPTFFYEMILNFIGFAIMFFFWRKDKYISTGMIFGMYLVAYGLIRAFVTMFRADDLMWGFLRAPHIVSTIFVIIGGFLIYRGYKIANNNEK